MDVSLKVANAGPAATGMAGGAPTPPAPPVARTVPFRAGGFAPRDMPWLGAATLVGLVLLWQAGASAGWIDTTFLATPAQIARALWALARSGVLWNHLGTSLWRLAVGWSAGTACGLAVGLLVGLASWARSPGTAVVSALFPIPKIALVPLFIIWFGIGDGSKFATLGIGVFFPTVLATRNGVDGVARSLVRMGQSFGLSRWAILTRIVLPGALPAILGAFRLTASIAIILLVAAEMIGAEWGIGVLVAQAGANYDLDTLFAGIVVLSALGLLVAAAVGALERAMLRWR